MSLKNKDYIKNKDNVIIHPKKKKGAPRRVDKTGWRRCRVCGKKSQKWIFFEKLPFTVCPACQAMYLLPKAAEAAIRQADSPILKPGKSSLIIPGR